MLDIVSEVMQSDNASDYGGSIAANTEPKWRAKGYCQPCSAGLFGGHLEVICAGAHFIDCCSPVKADRG